MVEIPTSPLEALSEPVEANDNNDDVDESKVGYDGYNVNDYLLVECKILDIHTGGIRNIRVQPEGCRPTC